MALLNPNDKPALLKRPSDGDIGGDLRNREKHLNRSNEMRMLRDLYPDYDPTTAQTFNEIQSAMQEWSASAEKLKETEGIWEVQVIIDELLKSINKSGYNISTMLKERKEFDMRKRINLVVDSSQSQSTTQDRLFDFDFLLKKFEQLREIVEKAGAQWLRKGNCNIGDIMTKLEEARSVIPGATQGIFTSLHFKAMDVPAHRRGGASPDDELEKHPSLPDAINSMLEREKAEVDKLDCVASFLTTMPATREPKNHEDAVAMWKSVALSLSTMQPSQLNFGDDSKADIWKIAAWYKSALPGLNFITTQIEGRGLGATKVVPLQQMERLLSGIPDAQIVAFFILCHLPEEHHALLSCTTIFVKEHTPIWRGPVAFFILTHLPEEHHALLSCTTILAEEHTPIWRGHVLFEEWSEEENVAFACEFSRLVPGWTTINSVLQKWHRLLEVLNPIIISIFSLCFAQT
ncbi:hypothetical protein V493_01462 [Pseudogymnoascus sp. VKM F-4281 (FW-2241)]|nr:hypothetical protein V493_01462 [Pseudogymnoascus sp. VKM F-4281 (FW-2241)]